MLSGEKGEKREQKSSYWTNVLMRYHHVLWIEEIFNTNIFFMGPFVGTYWKPNHLPGGLKPEIPVKSREE